MYVRMLIAAALAISLFGATNGARPESLGDSDAGIPVGGAAPDFKLKDQAGREQTPASLMGKSGLVLIFFRSADW